MLGLVVGLLLGLVVGSARYVGYAIPGLIDDAAKILSSEIAPIDDLRSSAEYRRLVSVNLLKRFWVETD